MKTSLLGVLLLFGCEPVLSADTVKLVQLPADVTIGPATAGVQTKEGRIFVSPLSGGFLRLTADGGAWEELPAPLLERFLPDFQEGLSLAQGSNPAGIYRAKGAEFVAFAPGVPPLGDTAFFRDGWSAVLGRDATGVFWATAAPVFGDRVTVAHLDPAGADWQYEEVPTTSSPQLPSAARPVLTSDARLFFRPDAMGLWELDLPNHVMAERVPCEHELFGSSCQEDVFVFAGRDGELFLFNASHELWRIAARGTTPVRVVKGDLPKLDTGTGRRVGPPLTYVDPRGRVWLGLRWGTNVDADPSFLYVAEPAKRDGWTFLKGDLPRTIALFGDGSTPLVSSGVQRTGLLVFRVVE